MLIIIAGVITILFLFHYYYTRPYKYWKNFGIPFYNKYNPYIDGFKLLRLNFTESVLDMYNAFPDKSVYGIVLLRQPQLMIKDPDVLRNICIKDFDHFTNHVDTFFKNDELLGKNLFSLKDQKWRDMRTILSPVFTGSKLRGLCDLMSECGEQTVEYYTEKITKENKNNILKVDLIDACTRFTNDVIATTAFGIKVNSLVDQNNEFFRVGQSLSNFPAWRMMLFMLPSFIKKIFNFQIFQSYVYSFFRNIVNETIEVRTAQNIIRWDMIHLLMEARKELNKQNEDLQNVLTNEDITAQGLIFFIAGFSNVAMNASFACYELAVNPDIQDKLHTEIGMTLKASNGKLDYDTLKEMKYFDMVISETLRKWTLAVAADRVCNKAFKIDTTDGVIDVKPGMTINIPVVGLHNDPKYFPNPQKFDPERFNETNKSKINPYTYIPFGLGPRLCIANRFVLLETKILLCHILKTFEIVVTDETPIPMVLASGGVIKPKNDNFGLGLKLRKLV